MDFDDFETRTLRPFDTKWLRRLYAEFMKVSVSYVELVVVFVVVIVAGAAIVVFSQF